MNINFKKIGAIATSVLLTGMTMGVAAAANYPNPFVVGGVADVAVVYGTGEGVSSLDVVQAGNIQSNLQSYMAGTGSTTTSASISGEAAELFSGGTKLYVNDSLNTVKSVLTKTNLPNTLADGSFSGNVDATISQTIDIGSDPNVRFKKQPTSSDDPNYALTLSTTQSKYIYNATATFSKAIAFNHSDSEGEDIILFGMPFTVSSATDSDTLVLLKSAKKVSLSSDDPSAEITINGNSYVLELISASDSSATIAITDSDGNTESKEINEAQSKKINGISVAVTTADETNLKLSATVVAGTDKVTLEDGSAVAIGESDTTIDGTLVDFETGTPSNLTALTISIYAGASDEDAIRPGESFVDPVFGSFKLDFSGFNIPSDSEVSREEIIVEPNGDDKMDLTFTDSRGYLKTVTWAKDVNGVEIAGGFGESKLMIDDEGKNLTVVERFAVQKSEYFVVGNEDDGRLVKVTAVKNSSSTASSSTSGDQFEVTDVFSGDVYKTTWTSDGVGTIPSIGGRSYSVRMYGTSGISDISYNVSVDYPDSSGDGTVIVYPTIETGKGAKIAFYEPITFNLSDWDARNASVDGGTDYAAYNLTTIKTPDGDGYTDIYTLAWANNTLAGDQNGDMTSGIDSQVNITDTASSVLWMSTGGKAGTNASYSNSGGLMFNLTQGMFGLDRNNSITLYLVDPQGYTNINRSALIVWEEKDDNSGYEATIIQLEEGRTGDDGLGVDTSSSGHTWHNNSAQWTSTRYSDSKITDEADMWGTILTFDSSDSDQPSATISYPDEQIYAQIYIAEENANIVAGQTTTSGGVQLGEVIVKDSEVSSVSTKNLVIVGGSCINSAAANVLGGAYCGAAFTEATGVGSGQYLIKGVSDAYTTGKLALVVAGYEATETVAGSKYLTTQIVDTSKAYKGTSSTSAEEIVATA